MKGLWSWALDYPWAVTPPRLAGVIMLACVWASPVARGGVLYVSAAATNLAAPDGRSWTNAFPTVQQALNAGVKGDEVWVAAGTYREQLFMYGEVALYGGFAGAEIRREQRDWRRNVTVLQGFSGGGVVFIPPGATNTARVDGFTIRGGGGRGGGINCFGQASPIIANNFITRNANSLDGSLSTSPGSGIYCERSYAIITNNVIAWNGKKQASSGKGGGIASVMGGAPTIHHNLILGNATQSGGGIYCEMGGSDIGFNLIMGNEATYDGGGIVCVGGSPSIHHNRIIRNRVYVVGTSGAGGALAIYYSTNAVVANNLVWANEAVSAYAPGGSATAGAFALGWTATAKLINNTLIFNRADDGICIVGRNTNASIFANNLLVLGDSTISTATPFTYSHNCFLGGGATNGAGDPTIIGTHGNIAADPRLLSREGFPFFWLAPDSPCRDAGDSSFVAGGDVDVDGHPRVIGDAVDIGAAESDGLATNVPARIIHVSPLGSDAADGSSWANAMRTIQAALDSSVPSGAEVWVRTGVYPERLELKPFTYLYGGFAGLETAREERDWRANPTTVDAGGAGSVVTALCLDRFARVDGFTLRHGDAGEGGGIACTFTDMRVANNVITENRANTGGGIAGLFCSPIIENNRVVDNRAWSTNYKLYGSGGGIYIYNGLYSYDTVGIIRNNLIARNQAQNTQVSGAANFGAGGGIYTICTTVEIVNNTIVSNTAGQATLTGTTGAYGGGARLSLRYVAAHSLFVNNIVVGNNSGVCVLLDDGGPVPAGFRRNCIFGNVTDYQYFPDPTGILGNFSADPRFQSDGDFLRLGPGSPCIDAGDDTVLGPGWLDLDGQPRLQGAHVDIGAYETLAASGALRSPRWLAGQGFCFSAEGFAAAPHVVQGSTNLLDWVDLSTQTGPRFEVIDAAPSRAPFQFYRVLRAP